MRQSGEILIVDFMVVVAQLVRAPGCGPGGRGFEPRLPPHFYPLIFKDLCRKSLVNAPWQPAICAGFVRRRPKPPSRLIHCKS